MKDAEIEKTKYSPTDKTVPLGYPKMTNSRPYLVPIFQEKYDYRLLLSYSRQILVEKNAWPHFKESEWKSKVDYAGSTILAVSNMQKV